jgi:hypothetical protein
MSGCPDCGYSATCEGGCERMACALAWIAPGGGGGVVLEGRAHHIHVCALHYWAVSRDVRFETFMPERGRVLSPAEVKAHYDSEAPR